jgi:hypothetical protein
MFSTSDLGKAAFLQLRGHEVRISVNQNGYWTFSYDPDAVADVAAYQQGAPAPAKTLATTMRHLKTRAKKAAI